MTLDDLNTMPRDAAERELARCCGSTRWAAAMAGRRPFADLEQLHRVSDDVWWSLDDSDWLEAFARHPRIGDRTGGGGWAGTEQAGARGASTATLEALRSRNHEYERRFGHVFLIFATGKSADEMLAELERRLDNHPATELRIAAAEQAKITRLRLEKLVASPLESSRVR